MTILTDDEIAKAGKDCFWPLDEDAPKFARSPPPPEAPATAVGQVPQAVAYLDIGAGGYLDIGSELSNEQLQQLPKGRHMLAIVGTFGVDGYTPAATEAPAQDKACALCGKKYKASKTTEGCVKCAPGLVVDEGEFRKCCKNTT